MIRSIDCKFLSISKLPVSSIYCVSQHDLVQACVNVDNCFVGLGQVPGVMS